MKLLIKPAIVLGAITGAIFGILMLIPYIQALCCFAFAFIGAAIVFYLKKNNLIGLISSSDGALIGAVSGFIAIFAAATIFLPINYISAFIFDFKQNVEFNILTSLLSFSYSIFAMVMIVFFIAMLSSLFNAFSALVVAYIYERLESDLGKNEEVGNDITIE